MYESGETSTQRLDRSLSLHPRALCKNGSKETTALMLMHRSDDFKDGQKAKNISLHNTGVHNWQHGKSARYETNGEGISCQSLSRARMNGARSSLYLSSGGVGNLMLIMCSGDPEVGIK